MELKNGGQLDKFLTRYGSVFDTKPTNFCILIGRILRCSLSCITAMILLVMAVAPPVLLAICFYITGEFNLSAVITSGEGILFFDTVFAFVLIELAFLIISFSLYLWIEFINPKVNTKTTLTSNIKEAYDGIKEKYCPVIHWR